MDRRRFLIHSAAFLFGSTLFPHHIARVWAGTGGDASHHKSPRVALIIDDIGHSRARALDFLQLPIPITYAVLPRLRLSHPLALQIRAHAHELLLHQPMEPSNGEYDPGPGALFVGDTFSKISETLETNFAEVPYAVGVNNHMGSKFTSSEHEILDTLRVIKERNLFFIDSWTSTRSKAYATARQIHMASACRNIFIDNRRDIGAILMQLRKMRQRACWTGSAIGIGHPFSETVQALTLFLQDPRNASIEWCYVSDLVYT